MDSEDYTFSDNEEFYDYESDDSTQNEDTMDDFDEMNSFSNTKNTLPERQDSKVAYESMNASECLEMVSQIIEELKSVLGSDIPETNIRTLLEHFKFDKEKLLERWFEDSENLIEKVGLDLVINSDSQETQHKYQKLNSSTDLCHICFENPASTMNPVCSKTSKNPSNCTFCLKCYIYYTSDKITSEGLSKISCINPDCKTSLNSDFILNLIKSDEKATNFYKKFLADITLEHCPQTRRCSTPNCEVIFYHKNRLHAKTMRAVYEDTRIFKAVSTNTKLVAEVGTKNGNLKGENTNSYEKTDISSKNKSSKLKKEANRRKQLLESAKTSLLTTDYSSSSTKITIPQHSANSHKSFPDMLKLNCKTCTQATCFNCGQPEHMPTTCELLAKWNYKNHNDSETFNWLSANTQQCPKCHVNIEKNAGCNHIVCRNRSCNHEFCWLCLGDWAPHGSSWFKCDRLDSDKKKQGEKKMDKSRSSLERYLHYFNRFDSHKKSLKLESNLDEKCDRKVEAIQKSLESTNTQINYIEMNFFQTAVQSLLDCRKTLVYAYCFGYYLKPFSDESHSESDQHLGINAIFCDNLNDLHTATENLSFKLEQDFGELEIEKSETLKRIQETENKLKINKSLKTSKRTSSPEKKHAIKNSFNQMQKQPKPDPYKPNNLNKNLIDDREKFLKMKSEILNIERYCTDRRKKLMDHVVEGFDKELWCFMFDGE